MIGEIIAIGDELTSGRTLNRTSNFAAHHLFAVGHEVVAMATIGDSPDLIRSALIRALGRADFIIVTGGLGPTSDDLTTETVSSALQRPVTFHPEILDKIERYLAQKKIEDSDASEIKLEKLAWLPAGAEELKPESNMAGYLLVHDEKPIFFLPGVPDEMKELMVDCVIPRLNDFHGKEVRHVRQLIYRVFGLDETEVNSRVKHFEGEHPDVRLGYYPVFPDVHLSLTVLGSDRQDRDALFESFDMRIRQALGVYIYGCADEIMAAKVGQLLAESRLSLATAESCTGGLISHHITAVPGSSDYFLGGITAYSNQLKMDLLQVEQATLEQYGAVSQETAKAMAIGIRRATGADIGVSVTGVAGPTGGTKEKPVGTVYFGLDVQGHYSHALCNFAGNRPQVQTKAAQTGLDLIRRKLLERG